MGRVVSLQRRPEPLRRTAVSAGGACSNASPLAKIRRSIVGPALLNPFFPETRRWGPADLPDPPTAASFSEFFKIARARPGKIGRNCAARQKDEARRPVHHPSREPAHPLFGIRQTRFRPCRVLLKS